MPFILRSTITSTYLERVKTTPDHVGFQSRIGSRWTPVTFREFHEQCRQVAYGLLGLGLKPQDRAVILSQTCYEWALADMAILGAGAVTVPIYASNTPEDCAYILNHSEARVCFAENEKQLEKLLERREELKHLEKIVVFEAGAMRLAAGRQDVMTLQALCELGRREEARSPGRFEDFLSGARPDDVITVCYTSGTTGIPKGVMITHDNMVSVLEDCMKTLGRHVKPEAEVVVSFLPFSHIIGKVESMAGYVFGWKACYAENLDRLMANIGECRPTVIFSVPRIFEKAYARINALVEAGPAGKKKLFDWAFATGRRYYSAIWDRKRPSVGDSLEYKAAQALVFSKIRHRFGGRLRFAICGGAPLPREIGEYFQIVGIPILEGYGLTETCAPVTLNTPEDLRFGTVGRPLPEVSIKIAEDGEILVKSRKVFKGYFKMPQETAEAIQDGWFHTGDIGLIESDGFVRITDRKKDLIITSGGKNIAPQKIENLARAQKYVSQFVVHGDRRNYLTAIITLDQDQIVKYANEQQILFSEYSELVKHPKIQSLAQKIVDDVNAHLASFETVKKFIVLPKDFSVEGGELTPSLKVKRNVIARRYQAELDSMYRQPSGSGLTSSSEIR